MVIIFDTASNQLRVLMNDEYRKWLSHTTNVVLMANAHGVNPFDSDPVKWQVIPLESVQDQNIFAEFKNYLAAKINEKNRGL